MPIMPERITVMHLRISNFIGGPEKQILEHFSRLDKKKFRPLLCCFKENGQDDPLLERAQQLGILCCSIDSQSAFDLRTIGQLKKVLTEEKVDILCSHGYKPNVMGRIAAWWAGIPAIAISRGWTEESFKIRLYERLDKFFLRLADQVVAVSNGQRNKILALGLKHEKVMVIHNAINLAEVSETLNQPLRQQLNLPADALIVASAGRLSPEKNYATMIEVAQKVIKENPKTYFVIFGEGFLRAELDQAIETRGLVGRFLLPGFRKDIQKILHDIDIFMLPSFSEGLPNVILEAFAARRPVVATQVGGTPEVVQDGISGFLTRPDQPALMAEHVISLLGNPELRRQMGEAGYRYADNEFGFGRQTQEYEQLYCKVAEPRSC